MKLTEVLAAATALVAASVAPASELPDETAFQLFGIDFIDDSPAATTIGFGAFNVFADEGEGSPAAELRMEYRLGRKWHSLGPFFGIVRNSNSGTFGYAGLYSDLRIGKHWLLTPAAGIGTYQRGNGQDLGGAFQFHLGLDVAYRFRKGSRVGLKIAHISNSDLQGKNPGSESLLLTYTMSFGERLEHAE